MRSIKFALIILFLSLATACTPLGALNAVSTRGDDVAATDIAYGDGPRQKLDIYTPREAQNAPVVVFFYGGRWSAGAKQDYRFAAHALTTQGFVVVVPDTRLYPQVRFPAFLEDAAQAVAWVQKNIARYGGGADHIFTMGHSSGAYNAVMLAMNPEYLKRAGGNPELAGAIGLAGPYDFLPFTDTDVKDIFSPANDNLKVTQPITFAIAKRPPVLLLQGKDDRTVGVHNSVNLAPALKRRGSTASIRLYDNIDHVDILLALSSPFRHKAPVLQDATEFIRHNVL